MVQFGWVPLTKSVTLQSIRKTQDSPSSSVQTVSGLGQQAFAEFSTSPAACLVAWVQGGRIYSIDVQDPPVTAGLQGKTITVAHVVSTAL
jgi:hypothetical protein